MSGAALTAEAVAMLAPLLLANDTLTWKQIFLDFCNQTFAMEKIFTINNPDESTAEKEKFLGELQRATVAKATQTIANAGIVIDKIDKRTPRLINQTKTKWPRLARHPPSHLRAWGIMRMRCVARPGFLAAWTHGR